jgi:hypothetical protein
MLPRLSTLRRCRALLALTVLAWLTMGMQTVALAAPSDCCAGMTMTMTMSAHTPSMTQQAPPSGHSDGMAAAHCPCAHSAASLPLLTALNLAAPMLPARPMPVGMSPGPQPARIPLLRPPLQPSYVVNQYA